MARHIKSGSGWRLGWNPDAEQFQGLVSGADWSFELTAAELDDLCRLCNQLSDTMAQMAAELMEEERITCEAETAQLWVEAEGFPHAYSLRFILLQGRGAEAQWPAEVVPHLLQAMRTIKVF